MLDLLPDSYVARMDERTLHDFVRTDPGVRFVEQEHYIEQPTLLDRVQRRPSRRLASLPTTKRWVSEKLWSVMWPVQMVTATRQLPALGPPRSVQTVADAGKGVNVYVLDSRKTKMPSVTAAGSDVVPQHSVDNSGGL